MNRKEVIQKIFYYLSDKDKCLISSEQRAKDIFEYFIVPILEENVCERLTTKKDNKEYTMHGCQKERTKDIFRYCTYCGGRIKIKEEL